MTLSLASSLPSLAPVFDMTSQALYERMRALVRMGLLPAAQGRGHRDGAVTSPETVSLLAIAVLTTDRQADERVRALASAPFTVMYERGIRKEAGPADRCPLTGAGTFHEAFAYLLSDRALISLESDTLLEITVSRREPMATISFFMWPELADPLHTEYGARASDLEAVMSVRAEMHHQALLAVREIVLASSREG